jgi:hypothetical protein
MTHSLPSAAYRRIPDSMQPSPPQQNQERLGYWRCVIAALIYYGNTIAHNFCFSSRIKQFSAIYFFKQKIHLGIEESGGG